MNSLYREEILEHYNNPLNYGRLKDFNLKSKQLNPFCGDEIEMFLRLESITRGGLSGSPPRLQSHAIGGQVRWKIKDVGFVGKGCAISIAASSILTEFIKGKTRQELTKFSEKDMLNLLGIKISETRKKCALLAFFVLKDAI